MQANNTASEIMHQYLVLDFCLCRLKNAPRHRNEYNLFFYNFSLLFGKPPDLINARRRQTLPVGQPLPRSIRQ